MKTKIIILLTTILILGFAALVVITTILPPFYPNKKLPQNKKIIITGHRGAAAYAPENTISSVKKALELGVDRIEVDVHQTKDGQVIVIHDQTVNRTTNGSGYVKDLTLKQIQQLDAGSWFNPLFKNEKIPTLEQIFNLINGKTTLLIEIKHGSDYYPNIEQNVINLIKKYNAYDWVIVQSFDDKVLHKFQQLDPKVTLHKLFIFKLNFLPIIYDIKIHKAKLKDYKFAKEISIYYKFINPILVKQLHKLGFKVNAWTVNDPKIAKKLIAIGVDGIISDKPDIIKKAITD